MAERERTDIKFEIVESIGVLNSYPTGWSKEVNLVRWNDKEAKYDIRDWAPGHERMSRGITMHSEEMKKLVDFCGDRFDKRQVSEKSEGKTAGHPEEHPKESPADAPF